MKKIKPLLFLIPSVITPIVITGCGCDPNKDKNLYVAIPREYLQIDGIVLSGIKTDKATTSLSGYNTLQVPTGITQVYGIHKTVKSGEGEQKAYDCIKYITFSDNSCTTLGNGNNSAFESLPNLEKITLPSSITSISMNAFADLEKLKTIDASALTNVSCIKDDCFIEMATNGTIYVKNETLKQTVKDALKNHDEMKTWEIKVK